MERVDSRPYPDSEESDDDVVYAEECESELQQINMRNEATNQITVDTCGERCAQLDDLNWFLPTDEWNEKSDTPESEIDTSDSGNGVHVNASDSSMSQTETTTQRLSGSDRQTIYIIYGRSDETNRGLSDSNAPATECPDGGQYFSSGYKTGIRRPNYS